MKSDLWGKRLHEKVINGNKQTKQYAMFLAGLKERTDNNKDAVVAVCGERGMGKSSFAIVSGMILHHLGLNFDFDNIYYGTRDINKAIGKITSSQKTVFVFDEMIDFGYSRDAMSRLNKTIAKILTKSRKLNNIYFFCIPRFRNLDSTIRNDVVHYWIDVFWKSQNKEQKSRFAMAALFRKDRNPVAVDPWGVDDIKLVKKRAFTPHDTLMVCNKIRSYVCSLVFPPIPIPIEKEYEELSKGSLKAAGEDFLSSFSADKKTS